jgi:acetylornithine deacetylase/succinyl-diaminopimelate desuccinylase-like protein
MMVSAMLRAQAEGADLPGDVVLAVVCDEEALGRDGAAYLVEEHASLFDGIRYAIGEVGAFSLYLGGKHLYPIQVAEKQPCWLRATLRGPSGHGSVPVRGGAMAHLAHLVRQLDRHRLPVHVTPVARMMFSAWAKALGGVTGVLLGQLTNPLLTDGILDLMGERGRIFDPLLHNTASPTVVQASAKINVIPSQVTVELDGRLLPGYGPEDLVAELRRLAGHDLEIEVVHHMPGPAEPDMGLFDLLAETLQRADPNGTPVPFFLSGTTDARLFSRLGIQTYGYLPGPLPPGVSIAELIHGADERIPVESVAFGADVIYEVLRTYSTT